MSEAPSRPAVYSIPPHRSFADALVAGILARQRSPLDLARGRILLPTNRAVRTVRDAFVRASGDGLLLPRLIAIGDPELGDAVGGALDPIDEAPLPPAIDPDERLFILAQLLARQPGTSTVNALREAADLARTLDQLLVEEIEPRQLRSLAEDSADLSDHWARLFARLDVIFDAWPHLLAERGVIDMADRRNRLMRRLAERWTQSPPEGFTIAAGITTTAPAVATLLARIARLPEGRVVLPALAREREMPEDEWAALRLDPKLVDDAPTFAMLSHPQYHLRLLLDRMDVGRGEVRDWHRRGHAAAEPERSRAVLNAMTAARYTDKWQSLGPEDRKFGNGVRAAVFADPAGEATGVAIALRRALEEPGKTAALITPDRGLAGRVSAILQRWGVMVDDSAGQALALTPPGRLAMLLLEAVEDDFSPIPFMALVKHPLVGGEARASGEWLRAVRRLDLALRGPRPAPGLDGIASTIANRDARYRDDDRRALSLIREPIETACRELSAATSIGALATALRTALTHLAGDAAWSGAAGRELSSLVADLEQSEAAHGLSIRPDERTIAWRSLMQGRTVRPPYGGHPRLQILGLLEARLVQSDLMILGGLNEGSWPGSQGSDPWLAPRLRRRLGLPGLDYRVGLAGHDFMSALGAPQVLLTRAVRDERAPTIASRFWLRLEAMAGSLPRDTTLERLVAAIDRPSSVQPAERPAPDVPAEHRPKRLSVTSVERLRADPFAFYASHILRLRALDPLDSRQIAAWQGSRVHEWLEEWLERDGADPDALLPGLERLLTRDDVHPMLRALWGARLRESARFLEEEFAVDRAAGRTAFRAEQKGEARIAGVQLYGIADRIDRCGEDALAIVDYKTGSKPTRKALNAHFAMQLGLLGLIAREGGFPDAGSRPVALEYWKFAKKADRFGERMNATRDELDEYLSAVQATFVDLADTYLHGTERFVAKLNPAFAPYGDYDQLMRLEEWYGRA